MNNIFKDIKIGDEVEVVYNNNHKKLLQGRC